MLKVCGRYSALSPIQVFKVTVLFQSQGPIFLLDKLVQVMVKTWGAFLKNTNTRKEILDSALFGRHSWLSIKWGTLEKHQTVNVTSVFIREAILLSFYLFFLESASRKNKELNPPIFDLNKAEMEKLYRAQFVYDTKDINNKIQ